MSINPVSSPVYTKVESYNRRSTDVATSDSTNNTTTRNSSDDIPIKVSDNSQSGTAGHGNGEGADSFKGSPLEINNLAEVLAKFDSSKPVRANTAITTNTKTQLQQTKESFHGQFADKAQSADAFHSLMQTTFGNNYDKNAAETLRQQTLAGDFSWMPDIKVVDGSSLADTSGVQGHGVALGAYDSASDTIYLSTQLLEGDPEKAVDILTEEVGHAIDTRVNNTDSAGDEGELFAKLVGGESLSNAQIQATRSENDHGTIEIDGETVEVEYGNWITQNIRDPFVEHVVEPIVELVEPVVDVVVDNVVKPVVEHVVKPVKEYVSDATGAVASSIKAVGGAVSNGITSIGDYLSDGVNAIGDKITDGFDFVNNKFVSPLLNAIPAVGPWLNDHIIQPGFGLLDTGVNFLTNTIDSGIDFSTHALSGAVDITTNLLAGDIHGAINSAFDTVQALGQDATGFLIESLVIPLKGIASFLNDVLNLTDYRGLRPEEQAYLETIYGDSLDYDEIRIQMGGGIESMLGLDPHAIGNDIFIPEDYFNSDGSLTTEGPDSGLDLLAHEAGHVWQFQNDGASYIGDAAISYAQSQIEHGDRNGAYDFTTAIEEMKPWHTMTPDEQAEIAMVIGEALETAGNGVLEKEHLEDAIDHHNGYRPEIELSNDQIEYLRTIHSTLLAG